MKDNETILHFPPGYRFNILFAAYLKYALQDESDPRKRLDTIEMIESLSGGEMPADAIKAIEPMPEVGIEIMHTAFQLDRDKGNVQGGCPEAYKVLTRCDVFDKLLQINPSLMTAITIYSGR